MRYFLYCAPIWHNASITLHKKMIQAMITNKLKSANDSWKLRYEGAVNMMKEELEEAREEYDHLSDLLIEADLDDEAYLLEDFVDNLEDYIDALDDAIDVYERMNDARKRLAQDWKKIQRKIHF